MNIAVIGADGQLGSDICEFFKNKGNDVIRLTIRDIDISSEESVNKIFASFNNISLVINTAAFHNPPLCEKHPMKAFGVNALGSLFLAKSCLKKDITLLHFSTDYVFNGRRSEPYIETDFAYPLNVYGNSKLSGEFLINSTLSKHYILRISGIYGKNLCIEKGYNFVDKMLELSKTKNKIRVVNDEILSPTFTEEIAEQAFNIINNAAPFGLYHVTAEGSCSWYEFAKEIFKIKKIPVDLEIASPDEFANEVTRPKYSVLENRKLNKINLNIMSHWKDGLKKYLDLYR